MKTKKKRRKEEKEKRRKKNEKKKNRARKVENPKEWLWQKLERKRRALIPACLIPIFGIRRQLHPKVWPQPFSPCLSHPYWWVYPYSTWLSNWLILVQIRLSYSIKRSSCKTNQVRVWDCASQELILCWLMVAICKNSFWGFLVKLTNLFGNYSIFPKPNHFLDLKRENFQYSQLDLHDFKTKSRISMLI